MCHRRDCRNRYFSPNTAAAPIYAPKYHPPQDSGFRRHLSPQSLSTLPLAYRPDVRKLANSRDAERRKSTIF